MDKTDYALITVIGGALLMLSGPAPRITVDVSDMDAIGGEYRPGTVLPRLGIFEPCIWPRCSRN